MTYFDNLDADVRRIELDLTEIPEQLAEVERTLAMDRLRLKELQESLEIAETNAALSANADAKDAETRKLQRQAATLNDLMVNDWKAEIGKVQQEIDSATVSADMLRRRFTGVSHIAHLRAAQLQVMATAPQIVR